MNYEEIKKTILENRISLTEQQIEKMDEAFWEASKLGVDEIMELSVLAMEGEYNESHVIEPFCDLSFDKMTENPSSNIRIYITYLCRYPAKDFGFIASNISVLLYKEKWSDYLFKIDYSKISNIDVFYDCLNYIENNENESLNDPIITESRSSEDIKNNKKLLLKIKILKNMLEKIL